MKQVNIFIETVICVTVKLILYKGGPKFLSISKRRKSETAMAHKKRRNIQSIQHARMHHVYCFSLNPSRKKMRFQLALNKTFCSTSQPLIHRQLKHCQRTKINKTMLSASPSSVFCSKFTISELKSK